MLLALICIGTAFAEDKEGLRIASKLHKRLRNRIFEVCNDYVGDTGICTDEIAGRGRAEGVGTQLADVTPHQSLFQVVLLAEGA